MPLEGWIQHSRVDQFLYDWQTLIAGFAALLAAAIAVCVTWRQIAATRDQTAMTVRSEQKRVADEDRAFRAVLGAAMTGVLAEVAWTKRELFARFRADRRAINRRLRGTPMHHQGRIHRIACCLPQAGQSFDE